MYLNNKTNRINNMTTEIISTVRDSIISYKYKLSVLEKTVKGTDGDVKSHTIYSATFPSELIKFMNITDKKIYFYENNGEWVITSVKPDNIQSKMIKIQQVGRNTKNYQITIPKMILNQRISWEYENFVNYRVNLNYQDIYSGIHGIVTIDFSSQ